VLQAIRDEAYMASAALAKVKGTFPMFDKERYCDGEFFKTLPEHVRHAVEANGLRNSHLTSIAPTGTISMCADNVSSSIEPVFGYEVERNVNTPDGPVKRKVPDYGVRELGVRGRVASQVTAAEHVDVLVTAQKYVDSAVSKTVNMDSGGPDGMKWTEFEAIYMQAWERGAKGCTTFNLSGKRGALLSSADKNEASCRIDEVTGRRECA
jgi:ribonucleoside-diphosphate reductase alpha chain